MNNQPRREPPAEMRIAGNARHEMFMSLTYAGFTEYQACIIIGMQLAGLAKGEHS